MFSSIFGKKAIDEPIVAPAELAESRDLQSILKGNAGGFGYNVMASGNGRVSIFVTLGRSTGMHLVAIGDKSRATIPIQKLINNKFLQSVQLEGDFSNYIKLYCTPGKQIELLEIFEPEEMQSWVSFCRAYDLEIFYDSLYISQAEGAEQANSTTTLTGDVNGFLTKNSALLKRL